MIIGLIKNCNHCGSSNFVKSGIKNCPDCGEEFGTYKINKAPAGWVKMEDYEINRRAVQNMLDEGVLTKEDIR